MESYHYPYQIILESIRSAWYEAPIEKSGSLFLHFRRESELMKQTHSRFHNPGICIRWLCNLKHKDVGPSCMLNTWMSITCSARGRFRSFRVTWPRVKDAQWKKGLHISRRKDSTHWVNTSKWCCKLDLRNISCVSSYKFIIEDCYLSMKLRGLYMGW
jgi:hypothetical protein